jgi:mgtE-like transporter
MTYYKAKDIVKQGSMAITTSVIVDSFAGILLNARIEALLSIPILLVLLPSLMDMTGDIGCMVGSKIATFLHLGLMRPKFEKNPYLVKYATAVMVVAVLTSLYLTFLAVAVSYLLGLSAVEPLKILVVVLACSVSISVIAFLVGVVAGLVTFKHGWDPDNTTIPIVTAVCDMAGAMLLLLAASLIGMI